MTRQLLGGLAAALVVLGLAAQVRAAIYTDGVGLAPWGSSGLEIMAWTQPGCSGFGGGLLVATDDDTLTAVDYTVGMPHAWYSVAPGTAIDPTFATTAPQFTSLRMPIGYPFLLGFWLDATQDHVPGAGDRLGWVRLSYIGHNLSLVDSAIESTGAGIIAGEATAVPEPTAALLAVYIAATTCLLRRPCN